jgi:hypothetical protein
MPDSPSLKQHIGHNRAALLPCLAVLVAGVASPACQQAEDLQVEPVAVETVAVEDDFVDAVGMESNSIDENGDEDGDAAQCLVPGPFQHYFQGEKAFAFKSNPTTVYPFYDPSVCNSAPFVASFSAGGVMTSWLYRLDKAKVGKFDMEDVGYGTLCFLLQDPTFSPFGPPLLAYGKIKVNAIEATILGQCTVTNDELPVTGVRQMSCALPLVAPIPTGYTGGLLVTNSVLNLAAVQGISTGSMLTLHLYKAAPESATQLKGPPSPASLLDEAAIVPIHPDATFW